MPGSAAKVRKALRDGVPFRQPPTPTDIENSARRHPAISSDVALLVLSTMVKDRQRWSTSAGPTGVSAMISDSLKREGEQIGMVTPMQRTGLIALYCQIIGSLMEPATPN
jgi:hypothetical protein